MASPALPRIDVATATIALGASLSGAVNMASRVLVGIAMPAAWTAADLTFQGSLDGTTFLNMFDAAGTEIEVAGDDTVFIAIDPSLWAGVRFIKVRSGTAGVPVNQDAERIITLALRDID